MNELGDRILELLKIRGITQRELAIKAGTTEVSISRYIHGTRTPKTSMAIKIASALNTDLNYLLLGIKEQK